MKFAGCVVLKARCRPIRPPFPELVGKLLDESLPPQNGLVSGASIPGIRAVTGAALIARMFDFKSLVLPRPRSWLTQNRAYAQLEFMLGE